MNPVEALPVNHTGSRSETEGRGEMVVPEEVVKGLCRVFKLLADETRFKILMHLLHAQELNVTELCRRLNQSQPAVSHHLALLRVAGLIKLRRAGKHNYYSVHKHAFADILGNLFQSMGHEGALRFERLQLEVRTVDN